MSCFSFHKIKNAQQKILQTREKVTLKGLRFGPSFRFISQNQEIQNRDRTVFFDLSK